MEAGDNHYCEHRLTNINIDIPFIQLFSMSESFQEWFAKYILHICVCDFDEAYNSSMSSMSLKHDNRYEQLSSSGKVLIMETDSLQ